MGTDVSAQRPGIVVEIREGETICLRGINGVDSEKIVLILESKDGRKARVRIQASPSVRVGKPEGRRRTEPAL